MTYRVYRIDAGDVRRLRELNVLFGEAFSDPETYTANPAGDDYLRDLLAGDSFIALAALSGDDLIGGLAAYELRKFERKRSEIYIYDLAVASEHRRRGVATALIESLKSIARERGAWVVFVQADTGAEDAAAIALYERLGKREDVLHFNIAVDGA